MNLYMYIELKEGGQETAQCTLKMWGVKNPFKIQIAKM